MNRQEWDFDFFDCCKSKKAFWTIVLVPCTYCCFQGCQMHMTQEHQCFGYLACCNTCLFPCWGCYHRYLIRQRYGIRKPNIGWDICRCLMCCWCALVQEYQTVLNRNMLPTDQGPYTTLEMTLLAEEPEEFYNFQGDRDYARQQQQQNQQLMYGNSYAEDYNSVVRQGDQRRIQEQQSRERAAVRSYSHVPPSQSGRQISAQGQTTRESEKKFPGEGKRLTDPD